MALFNYECDEVKRIIDEVSPNYPQLTTYEKEWLYFHKYGYIAGIPVELEYETVTVNPYGSVLNAIPFNYKSAILKGNTKLVSANGQKFDSYFTINDKIVKGKVIDDFTGGIKESSSDFSTIDLLPLPKPPFIITGNSSWKKIVYYDKDKQFIESIRALEGDIVVDENPSNAKYCRFGYSNTEIDASFKLLKSDGSDLDYPNLELISVQMPVLTTTGKNLLINEWENGGLSLADGTPVDASKTVRSKTFSKVSSATNYVVSMENYTFGQIFYYDKNYNYISRRQFGENNLKITIPDNCEYIKVLITNTTNVKVQIEEGATATPYEPYQSNILTVNEDVTLREIGDMQDTLDLMKGEVTQKIGEITFDGSDDENWNLSATLDNVVYFKLQKKFDNFDSNVNRWNGDTICNKFISMAWIDSFYRKLDKEFLSNDGSNNPVISIGKEKLTSLTVNGFKQWLSQNPITVQYRLANESIKTVDLTKLNKPFEGTNHYQLTSNIPCEAILEVPVVSTGEQTLQEINND